MSAHIAEANIGCPIMKESEQYRSHAPVLHCIMHGMQHHTCCAHQAVSLSTDLCMHGKILNLSGTARQQLSKDAETTIDMQHAQPGAIGTLEFRLCTTSFPALLHHTIMPDRIVP